MPDKPATGHNAKKSNTLPIWNVPIGKGQFIEHIFDELPTHTIINKTLTGIHATTKEILTERNSILLESNVPVIKDKRVKYAENNVIGVYKKSPDDLKSYLRSAVPYKKVMVTPESFHIVMSAMRDAGIDPYNEYFFLWDEVERTIQDITYRGKIILPIDDLFQFKQKCFISATAIPPTDKRFIEQNFTYIDVIPDYDYKQDIKLIVSNNTVSSLKQYLKDHASKHYFIFVNSTKAIAAIQRALKIKKSSYTFCSLESTLKLKINNYPNCSTDLGKFKKYNFFTSRFFSAVDIDLKGEPHIIILTDLVYAKHSMIDPFSEAVQIIGRFRKPVGSLKNVVHITNFDPEIRYMIPSETEKYLEQHEFLYNNISALLDGATDIGSVSAIREALNALPWKKYLTEKGTVNEFMKDNTYFEEKVKTYYSNVGNLEQAYRSCGYFNLNIRSEVYQFDDKQRQRAERAPLKNTTKMVMMDLESLKAAEPDRLEYNAEYKILEESFPAIIAQYKALGFEKCEELKFNTQAIDVAICKLLKAKEKTHFGFIKLLNELFVVGQSYSSQDIILNLNQALKKFRLFQLTPNTQLLSNYFKLSDRKTISYKPNGIDIKGYTILEAKFNY